MSRKETPLRFIFSSHVSFLRFEFELCFLSLLTYTIVGKNGILLFPFETMERHTLREERRPKLHLAQRGGRSILEKCLVVPRLENVFVKDF